MCHETISPAFKRLFGSRYTWYENPGGSEKAAQCTANENPPPQRQEGHQEKPTDRRLIRRHLPYPKCPHLSAPSSILTYGPVPDHSNDGCDGFSPRFPLRSRRPAPPLMPSATLMRRRLPFHKGAAGKRVEADNILLFNTAIIHTSM